jgi:hypothetical protein
MLPIAPHFISYSLPRSSTLVTYRDYEQINERNHNISIFGTYPKLDFILFCDGPIKDAYHKRKRIELWGSQQHINMSHNILPKFIGIELACV